MIHRWYWCHASNGNPNVGNRMTIRTPKMDGPMFILGAYWSYINPTMSVEFGYVEGEPVPKNALGVPIQPPTNGVGQFMETVFAPGDRALPRPPFTRFDHALMLQDDTALFQPQPVQGFVKETGTTFVTDYKPIRSFIPIWSGCICLSCTFTSISGTGAVDIAFEVIEDIFNIPPALRDALKGSDLIEFLGRLTGVAISQNSIINLIPFLWGDPIFQPYPDPVVPEVAKVYLPFIEAF